MNTGFDTDICMVPEMTKKEKLLKLHLTVLLQMFSTINNKYTFSWNVSETQICTHIHVRIHGICTRHVLQFYPRGLESD